MRPSFPGDPGASLPAVGLAAWLALVAVWLTWSPFTFGVVAEPLPPSPTTPADLGGNALLLAPFGFALGLTRVRRPLLAALALGALLSGILELGQLFLPSRVASVTDVVLNASGASAAAGAARVLRARLRPALLLGCLAGGVYLLVALSVLRAHEVLDRRVRLEGWNPTYGIVAGDELGADRRYMGSVDSARICAGAELEVCAGPGAPAELRRRLAAAAEASQRVAAEARVRSTSDRQTGPTRIVTFSRGAYLRNLTVGQEGTALMIRLRTPEGGLNGTGQQLVVPDALPADRPTRVRVAFDAGTVRVDLESARGRRTIRFPFDGLAAGILWGSAAGVTPRGLLLTRATALLLLVLLPTLGLAGFLRSRRGGAG